MEDLRIQKTRKALKQAIIQLLDNKPFEKISVTDICNESNISRITFYTHYDNKYDLINEIFNDYAEMGRMLYKNKRNNSVYSSQSNDAQNLVIFIDIIYEIISANSTFFSHISQEENPYLMSIQTRFLLDSIESFMKKHEKYAKLKYTPRQITGFMIHGLAGFESEARKEGIPFSQSKEDMKRLMLDLLNNSIFYD